MRNFRHSILLPFRAHRPQLDSLPPLLPLHRFLRLPLRLLLLRPFSIDFGVVWARFGASGGSFGWSWERLGGL